MLLLHGVSTAFEHTNMDPFFGKAYHRHLALELIVQAGCYDGRSDNRQLDPLVVFQYCTNLRLDLDCALSRVCANVS